VPDFSDHPDYDEENTVYGKFNGEIPNDIPERLGQSVTLSHYVHAYPFHAIMW